jgi:hypothetical protein
MGGLEEWVDFFLKTMIVFTGRLYANGILRMLTFMGACEY